MVIKYWECVCGGGGVATKRYGGGGASQVSPLQKGGTEQVVAMLKGEGGHKRCWCSFNLVLAMLKRSAKVFHPLKEGP